MKPIREKFEEIWPVPEGVYWNAEHCIYQTINHCHPDVPWTQNRMFDTFTRCQETTGVYVSLVDELVKDLESYCENYYDLASVIRAKQILEQSK